MQTLEDHIARLSAYVSGKAGPEILGALMDSRTPPDRRAQVYRNSGLLAATEALRSNYPALAQVLGEREFGQLARGYVQAHRPATRSLTGYGRHVADFVARARPPTEHRDWLVDIARLDRAWLEAHLAPDQSPLSPQRMAALAHDADALAQAPIALVAAARLVTTQSSLLDLWALARAGDPSAQSHSPAQARQDILIWRVDGEVTWRALSRGEHTFLDTVRAGAGLGAAAEAALHTDPELNIAETLAAAVSAALFTTQEHGDQA